MEWGDYNNLTNWWTHAYLQNRKFENTCFPNTMASSFKCNKFVLMRKKVGLRMRRTTGRVENFHWKLNKRGDQSKSACQILWLDLPTNQEWWWQIPLVTAKYPPVAISPTSLVNIFVVIMYDYSMSLFPLKFEPWISFFCPRNPPVLFDTLKYKLYWEARHLKHVLPNYRNISF